MSARAIAIHGNEKSGERRANLEIKSECPALSFLYGLCMHVSKFQRGPDPPLAHQHGRHQEEDAEP